MREFINKLIMTKSFNISPIIWCCRISGDAPFAVGVGVYL